MFALMLFAGGARAQGTPGASLAVGAAIPTGDFANTASSGLDIALQIRTDRVLGPLALRIDLGYDHFAGKAGVSGSTITTQAINFIGDLGPMFYIAAGPGFYQSQVKTMILTHDVTESRQVFGGQAAIGMNFPVYRWRGFVEVAGVKLFSSNPGAEYVPVRFGVRL
jgi:hypothetical protein